LNFFWRSISAPPGQARNGGVDPLRGLFSQN
jgi:hypothetical protein